MPQDNAALANLCGWQSEHLSQLELRLGVEINHLGFQFSVTGLADRLVKTEQFLRDLYQQAQQASLDPSQIHLALQSVGFTEDQVVPPTQRLIQTRKKVIKTRNANQAHYLQSVEACDVSFGIGPAGTGKTYLAVATAVAALEAEQVRRIILTRPAVEAGEKLGFLPGDMNQKVDPYLRPLFDSLFEMLGFETVERLIEKQVIEIAPLAFMRGRTLNESFMILDEAQNTSIEQMKMFLTRMGEGSRMVITGDLSQIDLPPGNISGLRDSIEKLNNINGIAINYFNEDDVVRHPLVSKIVRAYDK